MSEKDRIKEFLKKGNETKPDVLFRKLTAQEKKDFIHKKLFTEAPQDFSKRNQTLKQKLRGRIDTIFINFQGKSSKIFIKETLPFLAFIVFSSYIVYKMETEYDKMVRSVNKVKTFKQEQAEKEDEYIKQALKKHEYKNNKQIKNVPDKQSIYRFEEEDDLDQGDMNTKEDFLDNLRKDYNQGLQLPQQYKQDVEDYSKKYNKKLKFKSYQPEDEEFEPQNDIIVQPQLMGQELLDHQKKQETMMNFQQFRQQKMNSK